MFGFSKCAYYKICARKINFKCLAYSRLSFSQTVRRYARKISLEEFTSQRKTFYQVLGVNSNATHSEIKSAYYTLSMTFHPDKNKGDEKAAIRFREITEAYEILGSYAKRKRYDQGFANKVPGFNHSGEYDENEIDLSKRGTFKSRVPTQTGRTSAYNFDEWVKLHYQKTFQENQQKRNMKNNPKYDPLKQNQPPSVLHNVIALYLFLTIVSFLIITQSQGVNDFRFEKSFDKPKRD